MSRRTGALAPGSGARSRSRACSRSCRCGRTCGSPPRPGSAGRCASGGEPSGARGAGAGRRGARARRPAARCRAPAGSLAHGDKRKLELAMLLAGDPAVILLDEPMAGVSAENVDELVELIRSVHVEEGKTVLMVEHHIEVDHRPRRADRRHAPRRAARLRYARRGDGERDRAGRRTWGRPCDVGRSSGSGTCTSSSAGRTCSRASPSTCPQGGVTALLGRNGVGKTTTLRAMIGPRAARRAGRRSAATSSRASRRTGSSGGGSATCPRTATSSPASRSPRTSRSPSGTGRARYELSTSSSPSSRRGPRSAPARSRAGSSRWSRSARALLNENRVLLVDEPTKGLAPMLVAEVAEALERVCAELTTVLLVEQNLAVVRRVAAHVVVLDIGRVVQSRAGGRAPRRPRARPRAARRAGRHEHVRAPDDHRARAGGDVLPVASGLSLIYGLMGVLNFAHGALITVGAYGTWSESTARRRSRSRRGSCSPRSSGSPSAGCSPLRRARPDPAALPAAHRAGARHGRARARARPRWSRRSGARPASSRAAAVDDETTDVLGASIPNDRLIEILVAARRALRASTLFLR